jgi:hypothetical protein
VARGGNTGSKWSAQSGNLPAWTQTAIEAAASQSRQRQAQLHAEDVAEQRALYGRVMHPPVTVPDSLGTAQELEDLVASALDSARYDDAQHLYLAWLLSCEETRGEPQTDIGMWMIARDLAQLTQRPTLQAMLCLERTRDISRSECAHRLERRWLHMLGAESLWELLARAELETGERLADDGSLTVSTPGGRSDRQRLRDIHGSYRVWVADGHLNTKHSFPKADRASLHMKDGRLVDIRPACLASPTPVQMRERSLMNVERARGMFDPDTVVQLHEPSDS